jgi:TolA-binding protein
MSGMSPHGLRLIVTAAACLALATGGCQTAPVAGQVRSAQRVDLGPDAAPSVGVHPVSTAASTTPPYTPHDPGLIGEVVPSTGGEYAPEEEGDGFDWEDLAPSNIYKSMKKAAGYGPNEGIAKAAYEEGMGLFIQQQYAEAAKRFKQAADRWPDSTLEEDALFWLGESYFFADSYPKALKAYQTLLKKYSYTQHLDRTVTRLFAIGRYWEELQKSRPHALIQPNLIDKSRPWVDTLGYALKAYDSVRMYDPTGPLADDAVMATATAYFLTDRYEDAAYNYGILRKEYAKSDHILKAHLLEMESRQRMYQGPLYDAAPLEEANEIADILLTQFHSELGDQRSSIVDEKNRLVFQQAERDWAVAQFYEKKQAYGAARFYYQEIIKKYPQTRMAEAARQSLDEIREYPDRPPEYFKWIETVLPADE